VSFIVTQGPKGLQATEVHRSDTTGSFGQLQRGHVGPPAPCQPKASGTIHLRDGAVRPEA
jgi:hypothetical protein